MIAGLLLVVTVLDQLVVDLLADMMAVLLAVTVLDQLVVDLLLVVTVLD